MLLPTIAVCKAETVEAMRAIWSAMGEGPLAFIRPLAAAEPAPTTETAPTHFMLLDMACTDSKAAIWQAMAENNDLPPIEGVWGTEGVISAPDAQAAIGGADNLIVITGAGVRDGEPRDKFVAGALKGQELAYIPEDL